MYDSQGMPTDSSSRMYSVLLRGTYVRRYLSTDHLCKTRSVMIAHTSAFVRPCWPGPCLDNAPYNPESAMFFSWSR